MKLLQKLYNFFEPRNTETGEGDSRNELCSLHLAITDDNEYNFEIRWVHTDLEKTTNGLCNLILGISYGLFAQDIIDILKAYDGDNQLDKDIVSDTIRSVESQMKILENIITKNSPDKPLIKPSEVLRHDS